MYTRISPSSAISTARTRACWRASLRSSTTKGEVETGQLLGRAQRAQQRLGLDCFARRRREAGADLSTTELLSATGVENRDRPTGQ